MERGALAAEFYIEDHAVLYGLLVKYARLEKGGEGREAAARATVRYGRERGLRMAMRCRADGRELSPNNYLDYGEWFDDRGWSDFRAASLRPFVLEAHSCGWKKSWGKYGLTEDGSLYCQIVDVELVRGFNPANEVLVDGVLTQGAKKCSFHFSGAAYEGEDDLAAAAARRTELRPRTVKDFLFHSGHVLSAFRGVYLLEFGLDKGGRILGQALADYGAVFGEVKLRALILESEQNYLLI
ncbi:MAG: L-2-amino-thiazoline-4-carboxylic acid hydrolase [Desulfarculales bacterium]|nr:L-2-amino-thiazoline-4-carboxylic acid hydrolase [Desulfarculales bacterium]